MHQDSGRDIIDREGADSRRDDPGFRLGVVMLATRFPRLAGDIGNPDSFPFPVLYRTVPGARVDAVVRHTGPPASVADAIVAAARDLETEGAAMIATSCGFLGGLQDRLNAACGVPVLSSALVIVPWLRLVYGPTAPIGVLTFDSRALSPLHLGSAADGPLVVEGLEQGTELFPVISKDLTALDPERAAADAVNAARQLTVREPGLAAVLLECTNLSPYREQIAAATRLPVYDIMTAIGLIAGAHAGATAGKSDR